MPIDDPTAPPFLSTAPPSTGNKFFYAPDGGIRVGWRLLLFLVIFVALIVAVHFTLHSIPAFRAWENSVPKEVFVPSKIMVGEGIAVFVLFISAFLTSKIETKTFADYALPPAQAFGRRFWQGALFGFAMLSLLMGLIAVFHGFSLGGFALAGTKALKYAALYGIAFLLVGIFEEFSFRGYMQSTLGSGIGFWPAAIVLSVIFGAIHLQNSGEAVAGAVMAGSFGILAALTLRRLGSIWFAIGMHAAFDWGETYFYSVADSGFVARGHLLNASFHGPTWLTGGSVGPEGSLFALLVLLLAALAIHFLFPARDNPARPTSRGFLGKVRSKRDFSLRGLRSPREARSERNDGLFWWRNPRRWHKSERCRRFGDLTQQCCALRLRATHDKSLRIL